MNDSILMLGDCLTELPKLGAESVDLIATDPPYGISFMGKDWDKAVPSVEVWKECLRVLKPGAFAFVMSLPRLDVLSQMAVRLQEAGFRVDFTPLYWVFASGFPKATNISKAVTKKFPKDKVLEIKLWLAEQVAKSGKTKADIDKECGFSACDYLKTEAGEDAGGRATWHLILPYGHKWFKMKEVIGFDSTYDSIVHELADVSATREAPKDSKGIYGQYSGTVSEFNLTNQAKALDGSYAGFQPKPAVEVIIVAMKP